MKLKMKFSEFYRSRQATKALPSAKDVEIISEKTSSCTVVKLSNLLVEHELYKNIPGTKNSFRTDSENTNTKTQKHVHVYAMPKGKGKEIYSANIDGSGHDGNQGVEIPKLHADYFRSRGYEIDANNILESAITLDFESCSFFILVD